MSNVLISAIEVGRDAGVICQLIGIGNFNNKKKYAETVEVRYKDIELITQG